MTDQHNTVSPVLRQAWDSADKPCQMGLEYWNIFYDRDEFIWSISPNSFLESHVQNITPGKALDLAAGECRNAVWLAKKGWSVKAVDFSRYALEKGRSLAQANFVSNSIEMVEADLNEYFPSRQSFDLVTMIYLHLPWRDLENIILRGVQAVAPGGTFFLFAYHSENLLHGYGGPKIKEVIFNENKISKLLETELTVVVAKKIKRAVQTNAGTRFAINVLIIAKRS